MISNQKLNFPPRFWATSLKPFLFAILATLAIGVQSLQANSEEYQMVVLNGRVIDPETQLDAIRNLGINDGSIVEISKRKLNGKKIIDANGLVVAPGFIDIHTHSPTRLGAHMNLLDGVTTQLDLEAGAFPISFYGSHYQGGAQLNYGSSVGHLAIRIKVMDGLDHPYIFGGKHPLSMAVNTFTKPATTAQIEEMRRLLNQGLDQGGLGIGVLLDYITSAVSDEELAMLFDVAAKRKAPLFIHVRRGYTGDPAGLIEVIELAKKSKAALFVSHITHNAMGGIAEWLAMIDEANSQGANIATEMLSYGAGGTTISADVFLRRDWRKIFDITYEDVQWVATGEWLTKESWEKYSTEQPRGMVNHHYLKEEWMATGIKWPRMMISTDALPAFDLDIFTNPNIAGTFSRVLGHYVRDTQTLDLNEALAKMSLYQAQWMAQTTPAFNKKGRIQVDADADIVIFDPKTVKANATYGQPYSPPTGIQHVIVGGRHIVRNAERIEGRYPGKKLLGEFVK